MRAKDIRIAIVGATGAVGEEALRVMEQRNFPVGALSLLASKRSAGSSLPFRGTQHPVAELTESSFSGVDIAIFSAGSGVSRQFAPVAKEAGCVVIDNSSAFRMDPAVPLVVPEINAADLMTHRGIIANPNCTTAITLMALYPLHKEFGVKRIIASSYQAASGAGARGMQELDTQAQALARGESVKPEFFPHQIAFNVFPQVDSFSASGYTKEEEKMQNEGRKIMHHPDFRASITCVRVGVRRAHSVSVAAEFSKPITPREAIGVLHNAAGIVVLDGPEQSLYPTPLHASGKYDCFVGRIRKDSALNNGLSFFVCGDQLLKGAALNAVQIAEHLIT